MNRLATNRSMLPALELWAGLAAAVAAVPCGIIVVDVSRGASLQRGSIVGFFVSVFLGPILSAAGAWLDSRLGQSGGILLIVLGALLTFDGMIATYFVAAPLFLLVLLSLLAAILRRKTGAEAA